MLRQRVLTALVLVLIAAVILVWMPPAGAWYLFAAVLGLVAWEWVQFAGIADPAWRLLAGVATATIIALVLSRSSTTAALWVSAAAATAWLATPAWFRHREFCADKFPRSRLVKLLIGTGVVFACAIALGHLYLRPQGRTWFVLLLCLIAAADIGAYFAGRRFGKRKLAPAISPGKTWEGVFGGLLAVAVVAVVAGGLFGLSPIGVAGLVAVAVVTAAVSILGDLLASLMKRHSGLKDSSRLLPGHGGVIDRFDSLMAAAPVYHLGTAWLAG